VKTISRVPSTKEEISKSDESCISKPRLENLNRILWTEASVANSGRYQGCTVRFELSNLGFEMQDSSNFEISSSPLT
jgi:hypothetical protein